MKKFISFLLTFIICLLPCLGFASATSQNNLINSTIPDSETPYSYVNNITVKIPNTEHTVTLKKASSLAGKYIDENNIPVYRFALMEEDSAICFNQQEGVLHGSMDPVDYLWGYGDFLADSETCYVNKFIEKVEYLQISIRADANNVKNVSRNELKSGLIINGTGSGNNENEGVIAKVEFIIGKGGWSYTHSYYDDNDIEQTVYCTVPNNLLFAAPEHNDDLNTFDIRTISVSDDFSLTIQAPSTTTIRHNDGIILHADLEGELPDGCTVAWSISNKNFKATQSADGTSLEIISQNKGYTTFTVHILDVNGYILAEDSIEMYSQAGIFDKIAGFFRSLFGLDKILSH